MDRVNLGRFTHPIFGANYYLNSKKLVMQIKISMR